jgi:hypothetical protein
MQVIIRSIETGKFENYKLLDTDTVLILKEKIQKKESCNIDDILLYYNTQILDGIANHQPLAKFNIEDSSIIDLQINRKTEVYNKFDENKNIRITIVYADGQSSLRKSLIVPDSITFGEFKKILIEKGVINSQNWNLTHGMFTINDTLNDKTFKDLGIENESIFHITQVFKGG